MIGTGILGNGDTLGRMTPQASAPNGKKNNKLPITLYFVLLYFIAGVWGRRI